MLKTIVKHSQAKTWRESFGRCTLWFAVVNVLQSIWVLPQNDQSAGEFKALVEYDKANGGAAVFCTTDIQIAQ